MKSKGDHSGTSWAFHEILFSNTMSQDSSLAGKTIKWCPIPSKKYNKEMRVS